MGTQILTHILDILDKFKALSGLTTNVSKTKYALFGNAPDDLQITPTTGFTIENSPFRLLGITLTGDLKHLDINWLDAIKAVRLEIFQWSTIRLTTTAKVNVTKTCLLSKFTHLATALPLPNKDIITKIEKIFIKFINGKRLQFSKRIIFTPKRFGVLGIPDLKTFWSSLQCSWLKRLHTSSELWAKILLTHKTPTPMAFLTHNPEALSLRLSNPFCTQILERWKVIQSNLYLNPINLIHTNICNSDSTNFIMHIPPYRYVPLNLITDQDLSVLPKSKLRARLPLATWTNISPNLIQFCTSDLRLKIQKSSQFHGNFGPFFPPEMQITNTNTKGCSHFFNALSNPSFDPSCWTKFKQFSTDHNIPPAILEKQIIKLSNTSRAIEAKDLQCKVLRNTCINNNLHQMKILDMPKCTLCNHPTQNSTHRFYHCPQELQTWQLLTHITSQTLHPHDFSITTAILYIMHLPKNHPLIVLTNITRHIIDKAHTNSIKIHPNTFLYKILNHANIFAIFESQNETSGNASCSSLKFSEIWSSIAESCQTLLKAKNPQTS